jgi:hypothetical protein
MQSTDAAPWNLDYESLSQEIDDSNSDSDNNEGSIASKGSRVTVTEETIVLMPTALVTPKSAPAPALANHSSYNPALKETPPEKRNIKRKVPDDCHVIICWSQLAKLIQDNMVCSNCGSSITNLAQKTIRIATYLEFSCKCRKAASALPN